MVTLLFRNDAPVAKTQLRDTTFIVSVRPFHLNIFRTRCQVTIDPTFS
jgi:hypothetical protein